jgi:hypothetical protein
MHGRRFTITLHLRVSGDSLSGRLDDGSGREHDFAGWLGLIAAIDGVLTGTNSRAVRAEQSLDETARREP